MPNEAVSGKRIFFAVSGVTLILAMLAHVVLVTQAADLRASLFRVQDELKMRTALKVSGDGGPNQRTQMEQKQRWLTQFQREAVALMSALGSLQTEAICFTSVTRVKNQMTFSGKADSAVDFTRFISRWEKASLFAEIQIDTLREVASQQAITFHFHALSKTGALIGQAK